MARGECEQLRAQERLCPSFPHRHAADGPHEVVRQLPHSSDGEHQYRIKNEREQYERVVKESELERV
jgi:hypothetical protein